MLRAELCTNTEKKAQISSEAENKIGCAPHRQITTPPDLYPKKAKCEDTRALPPPNHTSPPGRSPRKSKRKNPTHARSHRSCPPISPWARLLRSLADVFDVQRTDPEPLGRKGASRPFRFSSPSFNYPMPNWDLGKNHPNPRTTQCLQWNGLLQKSSQSANYPMPAAEWTQYIHI